MDWPKIEVWRMSASRPWHLKDSHPTLLKHLKYSGKLEFHLIESILEREGSKECIKWASNNGYKVHIIDPAKGQGFAIWYYLNKACQCKYALKWEDDFLAEKDIPLDNCVLLMEQYPKINQICFNKRETMSHKIYTNEKGEKVGWPKEQVLFSLLINNHVKTIYLCSKEKWWFGTALWRISFIKPIFKYWPSNTHNLFNNHVIIPMARVGSKSSWKNQSGQVVPTPEDIREKIGCYIYGKTGDPRMVYHAGIGNSIWKGEMQEKWKAEGKKIIGI